MRAIVIGWSLLFVAMLAQAGGAGVDPGIATFNQALSEATTRMDNAAIMALWDDDGISLLPGTAPIVGKKAIGEFMDGATKPLTGAHMQHFEMQCRDIDVSGNWASEWCHEHQIVDLGGGKPPFDGQGNMLLVLHRDAHGKWHLKREMWNQAPDKP